MFDTVNKDHSCQTKKKMGLIKAFSGAIQGTIADQWKDIITAGPFDEYTIVSPGVLKQPGYNRGSFNYATDGVISNGSKIFVPENTAAIIFSQSGIEEVVTEPGGYEYQNGQKSLFNGDGLSRAFFREVKDRIAFGGNTADQKYISFVNLREIRGIRFGTRGPLMYHDKFYNIDLEVTAFGMFSIKVTDAESFIKNYLPANTFSYSFRDEKAKDQILSEFNQSFAIALNSLSSTYRISELLSRAGEITKVISDEKTNDWSSRFGFEIISVGIENIEFSDRSKQLVEEYNAQKMHWKVYEDVSQKSSNITAQQKIAEGVKNHGFGDMGGMMFGVGMVQGLDPTNATPTTTKHDLSFDEQIETLKKLKDLLDSGIITEEEFTLKKSEIMNL